MIYLDYSATTPVAPEVLDAMLPYFNIHFGNASSRLHIAGWQAEEAVNESKQLLSQHLNCQSDELYFTSGATEGINMILRGLSSADNISNNTVRNKILTLKTEHKAVLDTCQILQTLNTQQENRETQFINIDEHGVIDLEHLEMSIDSKTLLVSVMAVNNETGVVQPIEAIADICTKKNVFFFCDATQAVGKIPIDIQKWNVDALVFSAHKFYGPKGIGAVYLKKSKKQFVQSQITGGGQQQNIRSGTLNVPGIVGMAKAMELVYSDLDTETQRIERLNAFLLSELQSFANKTNIAITSNSTATTKVPHILNLQFGNLDSETLINRFSHELCVSNGSACNSAKVNPSHVLLAMGRSMTQASSSIRFSLGRYTTEAEIKAVGGLMF